MNKCVDVEHGKKSLDYRPLMDVVNQCETVSPLMSMSSKVPKSCKVRIDELMSSQFEDLMIKGH